MPTVQVPVQPNVEYLLSAVKQLSPDELHEFTRQFAEWQKQPGMREKSSETSNQNSKEEAVLIKATKERLPAADEKRLKQLAQKSERGTLTETDLEAYRALAQQAEELDFRRTKALVELVKLKGKSVYAVMKEIGWEEAPFE
jgi:crotonobetainyl-CoA:carnitine CoA-transferase CaiB-like acyl-CoA transferase